MSAERYHRMYPVSWDQLHRDCKALSWRLMSLGPLNGIYAITKGGLIPAAIIARELDIRLVDTVCVSSYDWKNQKGEVKVLKGIEGNGEGWLIVDDLVDTGRTAKVIRDLLPKAHFASIYAKPAGGAAKKAFQGLPRIVTSP